MAEPGRPPTSRFRDGDRLALAAWSRLPGCGAATLWRVCAAGRIEHRFSELRRGVLSIAAPRPSVARGWVEAAQSIDLSQLETHHRRVGVRLSVFGDAEHPHSCWMDPFVPPLLYVRGASPPRPVAGVRTVAIVGTRRASRPGLEIARELAAGCARRGVRVLSGLALGIDGAAHRAALETSTADGPPIAVVGSGPDRPYPLHHHDLWEEIAAVGAVLSEYPPGTDPARWRFPARNRVIVGLADVVVVVESRQRGGALGTAQLAAERGVPVLAVPGSIRSPTSEGTNGLIADGAFPCRGVDDVLCSLGMVGDGTPAGPMIVEAPDDRSVAERRVLDALGWAPRTLEHLVATCALGDGELATALLTLQVDGLVRAVPGAFERVSHSERDP